MQADRNETQVLIVDDQPSVRKLVARWLTPEGCHCVEADSARQAKEVLQSQPIHVVVLDVKMPGGSGTTLLRQIAELYPDLAVIMMTGQGDTHTAIDALTHGACAYLLKPVEREELIFHIRRALERRQLILDRREYTQHLECKVREQTEAIREAQEETIHRLLSASLWRDEETGMHLRRTGLLSEQLARLAGWSATEAELIRLAAPMHDVGKIGIPDAILRKPGPLTPEESAIMRSHTVIGSQLLGDSKTPMLQMAAEIALNHHEHWDGHGYPRQLRGSEIPESARIVSIVDVYDALSHARVYRPAFSEEEVLTVLRQNTGTHFDPNLMALFFSHFTELADLAAVNPDSPDNEAMFSNGELMCSTVRL